jgi:non-specific serine/threonine protein kinase/serine/threonine-protein kinase
MDERWRRAKQVFQAALERDPAGRVPFLDRECGSDPALRAEVEALLASHAQAATFLEMPAVALAGGARDEGSLEGRRVGPYRIARRLAEGGMGVVYLAVRADDAFEKRVAIKVVKRGADSEAVVRRFQHERQTLASLDHPNIARLLDGGATPEGLPYFAMDFVEGEPIDLYCDRRKLTIDERLALFLTVCGAVQYAHQNLVVHRDIKPDNILVTATGEPKLVDFGIAKVLSPSAAFQTVDLASGPQRLLTYESASPEQVRGEPITTATDVYSLGVLLYELLTGHRPYQLGGRRLEEIERLICDVDPPRPSTSVATAVSVRAGDDTLEITPERVSRTRGADPDRLRRRLAGDLDMIVAKAIRKEPQRRYASAEHLAEDLRRHLRGLPVIARPDTIRYRAAKFVKRHRAQVAAAALVLATLIGAIVVTSWQARIAEAERARAVRRFDDVRGLANAFLFEMHDAIEPLPGSTPVRQLLVRRALEYLGRLAGETSADSGLLRELAAAYRRIGDVQGNPYNANLGDHAGAMDSYRRSLQILESAGPAALGDPAVRGELAASHERVGDIRSITGDLAGALDAYRRAYDLRSAQGEPAGVEATRDLAETRKKLAEALSWTGDLAGALEHHRRALVLRERVAARAPGDPDALAAFAGAHTSVGEMLVASNDAAGALRSFRTALRIAESASSDGVNVRLRRQQAIALGKIGEALAAGGDLAGAAASHRAALAVRQSIHDADPANAQARRDLAISHIMLAGALDARRERAGIGDHVRAAIETFESLAAAGDASASARADLSLGHSMAGTILLDAGEAAAAIRHFDRAVALAEAVARRDASDVDTRRHLASAYNRLAAAHAARAAGAGQSRSERLARWTEARSWYEKARHLLTSMRAAGALQDRDAEVLESIARDIERCDRAIGR